MENAIHDGGSVQPRSSAGGFEGCEAPCEAKIDLSVVMRKAYFCPPRQVAPAWRR